MLKTIITSLLICACICSNAQREKPAMQKTSVKPTPGVTKYLSTTPSIETTTKRKDFPIPVVYKLFYHKSPNKANVRGIILLSNYDADINTALLINIATSLANENFIAVIIQHRAAQATSFAAQADTIGKDYENVWNEISTKYGGTKANTVIGGSSLSGFAVSYLINQPGFWNKGIKGVALIAASTNPYIGIPVINKVCSSDPDVNDKYGNRGGTELQNELNLKNPSIAALSSCDTDSVCIGHHISDTWAGFFITKIKAWFP